MDLSTRQFRQGVLKCECATPETLWRYQSLRPWLPDCRRAKCCWASRLDVSLADPTQVTPDFRYQLPMRFKSILFTRCCPVKEGVESSLDWNVKKYRKGMKVIQSLGYVHSNLKPSVPIQVLPCIFGYKNNIATIAFVTYVKHKMLCSFRIRNWEGICKNLLWHNLFFKDINLGTVSYVV